MTAKETRIFEIIYSLNFVQVFVIKQLTKNRQNGFDSRSNHTDNLRSVTCCLCSLELDRSG